MTEALRRHLEQALRGLRYGTVQLTVHDAKVVRVERVERIRLTGSPEASATSCGCPTADAEERHDHQET